jgi:hypothetical protein
VLGQQAVPVVQVPAALARHRRLQVEHEDPDLRLADPAHHTLPQAGLALVEVTVEDVDLLEQALLL